MMSPRVTKMALIAALLFGCVSHDGTYLSECVAYEGSSIKLSDGQFVWERFTDSVVLDDAGNDVNQHPGYPLQGSFRVTVSVNDPDDGGRTKRRRFIVSLLQSQPEAHPAPSMRQRSGNPVPKLRGQ